MLNRPGRRVLWRGPRIFWWPDRIYDNQEFSNPYFWLRKHNFLLNGGMCESPNVNLKQVTGFGNSMEWRGLFVWQAQALTACRANGPLSHVVQYMGRRVNSSEQMPSLSLSYLHGPSPGNTILCVYPSRDLSFPLNYYYYYYFIFTSVYTYPHSRYKSSHITQRRVIAPLNHPTLGIYCDGGESRVYEQAPRPKAWWWRPSGERRCRCFVYWSALIESSSPVATKSIILKQSNTHSSSVISCFGDWT